MWTTKSFEEATLKVINLRGDADTVGSITGQIAGAFYGFNRIPKSWIRAVSQWDNYDTGTRALRLFYKTPINISYNIE